MNITKLIPLFITVKRTNTKTNITRDNSLIGNIMKITTIMMKMMMTMTTIKKRKTTTMMMKNIVMTKIMSMKSIKLTSTIIGTQMEELSESLSKTRGRSMNTLEKSRLITMFK